MKIIDLLNKIANGEKVPNKIRREDIIYAYSEIDKDYLEYPFSDEEYKGLFDMRDSILTQFLNDEVEIIEDDKKDKKIEKLDLKYDDIIYHEDVFFKKEILLYCDNLQEKINEIIDKLEEIK